MLSSGRCGLKRGRVPKDDCGSFNLAANVRFVRNLRRLSVDSLLPHSMQPLLGTLKSHRVSPNLFLQGQTPFIVLFQPDNVRFCRS